jgi:hypothetical protein
MLIPTLERLVHMSFAVLHYEQHGTSAISLIERVLTDGSEVYSVAVTNRLEPYPGNNVEMEATDLQRATNLFKSLLGVHQFNW